MSFRSVCSCLCLHISAFSRLEILLCIKSSTPFQKHFVFSTPSDFTYPSSLRSTCRKTSLSWIFFVLVAVTRITSLVLVSHSLTGLRPSENSLKHLHFDNFFCNSYSFHCYLQYKKFYLLYHTNPKNSIERSNPYRKKNNQWSYQ